MPPGKKVIQNNSSRSTRTSNPLGQKIKLDPGLRRALSEVNRQPQFLHLLLALARHPLATGGELVILAGLQPGPGTEPPAVGAADAGLSAQPGTTEEEPGVFVEVEVEIDAVNKDSRLYYRRLGRYLAALRRLGLVDSLLRYHHPAGFEFTGLYSDAGIYGPEPDPPGPLLANMPAAAREDLAEAEQPPPAAAPEANESNPAIRSAAPQSRPGSSARFSTAERRATAASCHYYLTRAGAGLLAGQAALAGLDQQHSALVVTEPASTPTEPSPGRPAPGAADRRRQLEETFVARYGCDLDSPQLAALSQGADHQAMVRLFLTRLVQALSPVETLAGRESRADQPLLLARPVLAWEDNARLCWRYLSSQSLASCRFDAVALLSSASPAAARSGAVLVTDSNSPPAIANQSSKLEQQEKEIGSAEAAGRPLFIVADNGLLPPAWIPRYLSRWLIALRQDWLTFYPWPAGLPGPQAPASRRLQALFERLPSYQDESQAGREPGGLALGVATPGRNQSAARTARLPTGRSTAHFLSLLQAHNYEGRPAAVTLNEVLSRHRPDRANLAAYPYPTLVVIANSERRLQIWQRALNEKAAYYRVKPPRLAGFTTGELAASRGRKEAAAAGANTGRRPTLLEKLLAIRPDGPGARTPITAALPDPSGVEKDSGRPPAARQNPAHNPLPSPVSGFNNSIDTGGGGPEWDLNTAGMLKEIARLAALCAGRQATSAKDLTSPPPGPGSCPEATAPSSGAARLGGSAEAGPGLAPAWRGGEDFWRVVLPYLHTRPRLRKLLLVLQVFGQQDIVALGRLARLEIPVLNLDLRQLERMGLVAGVLPAAAAFARSRKAVAAALRSRPKLIPGAGPHIWSAPPPPPEGALLQGNLRRSVGSASGSAQPVAASGGHPSRPQRGPYRRLGRQAAGLAGSADLAAARAPSLPLAGQARPKDGAVASQGLMGSGEVDGNATTLEEAGRGGSWWYEEPDSRLRRPLFYLTGAGRAAVRFELGPPVEFDPGYRLEVRRQARRRQLIQKQSARPAWLLPAAIPQRASNSGSALNNGEPAPPPGRLSPPAAGPKWQVYPVEVSDQAADRAVGGPAEYDSDRAWPGTRAEHASAASAFFLALPGPALFRPWSTRPSQYRPLKKGHPAGGRPDARTAQRSALWEREAARVRLPSGRLAVWQPEPYCHRYFTNPLLLAGYLRQAAINGQLAASALGNPGRLARLLEEDYWLRCYFRQVEKLLPDGYGTLRCPETGRNFEFFLEYERLRRNQPARYLRKVFSYFKSQWYHDLLAGLLPAGQPGAARQPAAGWQLAADPAAPALLLVTPDARAEWQLNRVFEAGRLVAGAWRSLAAEPPGPAASPDIYSRLETRERSDFRYRAAATAVSVPPAVAAALQGALAKGLRQLLLAERAAAGSAEVMRRNRRPAQSLVELVRSGFQELMTGSSPHLQRWGEEVFGQSFYADLTDYLAQDDANLDRGLCQVMQAAPDTQPAWTRWTGAALKIYSTNEYLLADYGYGGPIWHSVPAGRL